VPEVTLVTRHHITETVKLLNVTGRSSPNLLFNEVSAQKATRSLEDTQHSVAHEAEPLQTRIHEHFLG